MMDLKLKTIQT